ncbi:orotate phosphoribosyltransferase [Arcanobacterium bovis]|uniref:Orotate phosphoribosyltransferase n=2 Tax=Arcanobacterium bovis TaxID=2529275 RepID=A0A4V2KR30_9ACTO|nr:orotate phosphoribosyltransferase [Arcanobacterium bovis]TBW21608.1 orotate phosphoribosyltransferase [Arcanobacterium bovis]
MNDTSSEIIAKDLLDIQAVFFRPDDPFTWASGIKSPVYCDNRLILTAPAVRERVEEAFARLVKSQFPAVECLMGTATAGIAHAAIVASQMGLPMGYVRAGSKDHGRCNQIEGRLTPGTRVVVMEDLISTGGSVLDAVAALREAGAQVLGVVSIFTYGMERAKRAFADAGVEAVSLVTFDDIARVAAETGYIDVASVAKLLAFRANPSDESWQHAQLDEEN